MSEKELLDKKELKDINGNIDKLPVVGIKGKIDVFDALYLLLKHWYIIIPSVIIFMIIGYYKVQQIEPTYRSKLTLYPSIKNKGQGSGISTMASLLGGIEGGSNYNIPEIVKSRRIAEKIIEKKWESVEFDNPVNLIEYWHIEGASQQYKRYLAATILRRNINTRVYDSGLIEISVRMKEAQLSADIANYIGVVLSEYIQTIENQKMNLSPKRRKIIDERIKIIKSEMKRAEDKLKKFVIKNSRIISMSPEIEIEYEKLKNILKYKQEVLGTLEKESESLLVKDLMIEDAKNVPVINILDKAEKPLRWEKTDSKFIMVTMTFTGFVLGLVLVLFIPFGKFIINMLRARKIKYDAVK